MEEAEDDPSLVDCIQEQPDNPMVASATVPFSKSSSSSASHNEEVSAICAGAYGVGEKTYMLFIKSTAIKDKPTLEEKSVNFYYEAYSLLAPNRRLDGPFSKFTAGLPYNFNCLSNGSKKDGSICPISSKAQDITLRLQKDPKGASPLIRGSIQPSKGRTVSFQILDLPSVNLFNGGVFQLFRDQVPEACLSYSFGGDFMLEVRTGISQKGTAFPCVGKITNTIYRNDFSNITIRDIPPP
jgi:hypothetical protein